ncbi:TIGR04222 domain-containing membrane protein [Streptomyces sp. WAC 01529]|uniref:TIGR04222 domain-containing membrane protein n=1 Tax=Streptomyces sp. WAC 01529 TaxID=2203205 RepID=UPI000F6FB4DC|nr:TIGR04222 domain-containing membrane protein [Streptomyces sp. WAC 01529]AZM56132.1 TIGR04222 domain-containing membrane protein [Streptomyces sp. WAC 01529]
MFWVPLLLLAWAVTGLACGRLCLAASRAADQERAAPRGHELTLYEAAFLSGGPARVADVALVAMARARRLLIAHTGWATVVDPVGRDDMERSVLGAIGPAGQSRIAPIRRGAATAEAVRALADRLVAAGLAVPEGVGSHVASAVRQVRAATVAVLALGAAAVLMPAQGQGASGQVPVAVWFGLPLLMCVGCLAIARVEVHPYTRWASPAGQRLLGALPTRDDQLAAVAVRGVRAVAEPELRAALTDRGRRGVAQGGL